MSCAICFIFYQSKILLCGYRLTLLPTWNMREFREYSAIAKGIMMMEDGEILCSSAFSVIIYFFKLSYSEDARKKKDELEIILL